MFRTGGGGAEFSACSKSDDNDDCCGKTKDGCRCKKMHNYYQWVAYILVLQVTETRNMILSNFPLL